MPTEFLLPLPRVSSQGNLDSLSTSLSLKGIEEAWEMSEKCVPHKQKGLGSDPQHPWKKRRPSMEHP